MQINLSTDYIGTIYNGFSHLLLTTIYHDKYFIKYVKIMKHCFYRFVFLHALTGIFVVLLHSLSINKSIKTHILLSIHANLHEHRMLVYQMKRAKQYIYKILLVLVITSTPGLVSGFDTVP